MSEVEYRGIKHATLTNTEERALVVALSAARIAGDRTTFLRVRDRLLVSNLRLVWHVAKRYLGRGVAADDLMAFGVAGALYGLENFDASFGVRIATYLIPAIRSGVGRAVANLGRSIRLPDGVLRDAARARRVAREHHTRYGADPDVDTLAALAGLTPSRARTALAAPGEPLSFETPTGDEDAGGTLADTIASPNDDPEAAALQAERDALAWRLLSDLDARSRAIVIARMSGQTLDESAAPWGVGRERARQIERDALATLRARMQEDAAELERVADLAEAAE